MISAEAHAALMMLDQGARFNTLHTTARELMTEGLALEDWGYLAITETGRKWLRKAKTTTFHSLDEYVANIDSQPRRVVDPMAAPHLAEVEIQLDQSTGSADVASIEIAEEAPIVIVASNAPRDRALRAAGVASGVTGVWVDAVWIDEFVKALYADEDSAA